MSTYFVMDCRGHAPVARVTFSSDIEDVPWMTGAQVRNPDQVLLYNIHSKRRGNLKAMYKLDAPLIRVDLLQVLIDAGVDNLQLFEAVVRDTASGEEHKNYRAFNVVGVISAADMSESSVMHDGSLTGLDHDFANLVLDEQRIPSKLLLFRLAESVNAIIVHEKIKKTIEAQGIEGMVFYGSGEWSG